MKQIDRLCSMNAEEMAEFIDNIIRNIDCNGCPAEEHCLIETDRERKTCAIIIAEWLESDVDKDDLDKLLR